MARQADAPFLRASSGEDTLGRTVEAFDRLGACRRRAGIAKGLRALEQEVARVAPVGFGAAELDRAKRDAGPDTSGPVQERDKARAAPTPGSASRTS